MSKVACGLSFTATDEQRFWSKVSRGAVNECWMWTATRTHGYGYFSIKRNSRRAHRIAYELLVGPIPPDLQLDHLCRNPACVNPAHLEPVTGKENTLRSDGVTAVNARKTHCKHGHELTEDNIILVRLGRLCRKCSVANGVVNNAKKRARNQDLCRNCICRPKAPGRAQCEECLARNRVRMRLERQKRGLSPLPHAEMK